MVEYLFWSCWFLCYLGVSDFGCIGLLASQAIAFAQGESSLASNISIRECYYRYLFGGCLD